MKNALNNQVGMLGDMFLWLVANFKPGGIYFIKQALPPNISAGSVHTSFLPLGTSNLQNGGRYKIVPLLTPSNKDTKIKKFNAFFF